MKRQQYNQTDAENVHLASVHLVGPQLSLSVILGIETRSERMIKIPIQSSGDEWIRIYEWLAPYYNLSEPLLGVN